MKHGHNWEEDYPLENGRYRSTCIFCGNDFIGHKRRVSCKRCAVTKEWAEPEVKPE